MVHDDAVGVLVCQAFDIAAVGRDDLDGTALIHAEPPLGDVEVVRAPISHGAAGVVAIVAPARPAAVVHVRCDVGVERAPRGRPEPQVPIKPLRDWFGGQAPGFARRAADVHVDRVGFADAAAADHLAGKSELVGRPLLAAGLEDAAVTTRRSDHGLALTNGQGQGLFAVHVLAGFHGRDADQGVPVVRRGHDDGVYVVARDDLSEVPVGLDAVVGLLAKRIGVMPVRVTQKVVEPNRLDVAQRKDLRVAAVQEGVVMPAHLPTQADAPNGNPVVRPRRPQAQRGRRHNLRQGRRPQHARGGPLEKPSPIQIGRIIWKYSWCLIHTIRFPFVKEQFAKFLVRSS